MGIHKIRDEQGDHVLTEAQADPKNRANWLKEMTEYRELLLEDARNLSVEAGDITAEGSPSKNVK